MKPLVSTCLNFLAMYVTMIGNCLGKIQNRGLVLQLKVYCTQEMAVVKSLNKKSQCNTTAKSSFRWLTNLFCNDQLGALPMTAGKPATDT